MARSGQRLTTGWLHLIVLLSPIQHLLMPCASFAEQEYSASSLQAEAAFGSSTTGCVCEHGKLSSGESSPTLRPARRCGCASPIGPCPCPQDCPCYIQHLPQPQLSASDAPSRNRDLDRSLDWSAAQGGGQTIPMHRIAPNGRLSMRIESARETCATLGRFTL